MKLWDAYGEFAVNYVDEIYQCDEDVANDDVVITIVHLLTCW